MLTCLAASVLSGTAIFRCEMTMQDRAYKVKKLDSDNTPPFSVVWQCTQTNELPLSYRWQRKEERWVTAEQMWLITSHQNTILWNTYVINASGFKGYFLVILCWGSFYYMNKFWNIQRKLEKKVKYMKEFFEKL